MRTSPALLLPLVIAVWMTIAAAAGQLVTVNLGKKGPDFGAAGEASAILHLLRTRPGASRYEAAYVTANGEVVVHCDFEHEVIVRTITRRDGHGVSETWSRHTLFRLQKAASGGSLNDSPEGKLYGTLSSF